MAYFYSNLVEIETLIVELDEMELSETEKHHLAKLADESLHHAIMDAILSKLPDEERRKLMEHVSLEKHDKVWQTLNKHISEVENIIRETAKEVKEDLKKDIKDAKKLKLKETN
jgi:DICT domain-containing protein